MYTCQCCGYKTLEENEHNYEICPICFWEDDPVQFENPLMTGGANAVSLITAQNNFISYGCSEICFKKNIRKIEKFDEFDINWRPELIKKIEEFIKNGISREYEKYFEKEELKFYFEALFNYDKNELKKILLREISKKESENKEIYLSVLAQYKSDKEIQEFFVRYYLETDIEEKYRKIANDYLNDKSIAECLSFKEIVEIIEKDKLELEQDDKEEWRKVEIIPQLWKVNCKSYFMWAVGIKKDYVIFYNDVEEGFNISIYYSKGIINDCWCNQDTIRHTLYNLSFIK